MEKIKRIIDERLKGAGKIKLIVLLGIGGMLLILLSGFSDGGQTPKASDENSVTAEQYCKTLEEKLTKLVSGISGAGRCEVLVTLENMGEKIYLSDGNRTSDRTEEAIEGENKTSEKISSEDQIVVIDGGDSEIGIVSKELQPEIRGVVVVCEGGGSSVVNQRVVSAVTTALNISSARVYVTELSTDEN